VSQSHNDPQANGESSEQIAVFRTFYEANIGLIYRYIYSKVGNREEAEDLTAQVFTKALRGIDWSRDSETLRHWLLQVARTTIADYWRATFRLRTTSLDDLIAEGWEGPIAENPPPPDMIRPREEVAAIMAQLPKNYREVLHYRFLQNYSIKETARQLGLTEANVKVLQFRALKRAAELRTMHTRNVEAMTDEHA